MYSHILIIRFSLSPSWRVIRTCVSKGIRTRVPASRIWTLKVIKTHVQKYDLALSDISFLSLFSFWANSQSKKKKGENTAPTLPHTENTHTHILAPVALPTLPIGGTSFFLLATSLMINFIRSWGLYHQSPCAPSSSSFAFYFSLLNSEVTTTPCTLTITTAPHWLVNSTALPFFAPLKTTVWIGPLRPELSASFSFSFFFTLPFVPTTTTVPYWPTLSPATPIFSPFG